MSAVSDGLIRASARNSATSAVITCSVIHCIGKIRCICFLNILKRSHYYFHACSEFLRFTDVAIAEVFIMIGIVDF